jgi:hypothetical protein
MWTDFKCRVTTAGMESIGYKSYANKKAFWDKEVKKLIQDRQQANKMYRLWSKHPNCSPELLTLLWDDYVDKKRKVANKVKQNIVIQKTKVITKNASKATNNSRSYWNMLRKLNKTSDYPLRIRDPDHPDIIIDDPVLIKQKLSTYWSSLGNSENTIDSKLQDRLQLLESSAASAESLQNVTINDQQLQQALSKLKNAKSVGVDNIPGEFLKYGGATLKSALLDLFNKIKLLEKIPEEWFEGIVKPIHKDGNRELLSNYRGITISCVIYKVLVSIIENQVMNYVEDKNLLGETQGAFRKGRRCEDHIFVLKGICSHRKSKKKKTYLAFLDVSKAFDTLDRGEMFCTLWDRGIQGKAWRLIRMLYHRVDNKVIFGNYESEIFQVVNGVKQGCILSPSLFNLVMLDLDILLQGHGGVTIGSNKIRGLYYADDIVLFADSENDLVHMLSLANIFANKWGLKFNSVKSQILIVGKKWSDKLWPLGNTLLKETKTYKYLGVIINRLITDTNHISDHLLTKGKHFDSYMRYTLAKHMDINRIDFSNTLWIKAILPSLSHAFAMWFNQTKISQKCLKSIQYKCAKAALKLYCMPSQIATLGELGWLPITNHLDNLRVSYFMHLKSMDDHRLTKIIFNELSNLYNANVPTPFAYFKNMKNIFIERGVDHFFSSHKNDVVTQFRGFNHACYAETFSKAIDNLPSLKYYKLLKMDMQCTPYLYSNSNFKAVQIKFKLRTGVAGLGEDLLRQKRDDGFCKYCRKFETLKHFIFYCPAYATERQTLFFNVAKAVDTETFSLFIQNVDSALGYLLGDHDDIFNKQFLLFVQKAWTITSDF